MVVVLPGIIINFLTLITLRLHSQLMLFLHIALDKENVESQQQDVPKSPSTNFFKLAFSPPRNKKRNVTTLRDPTSTNENRTTTNGELNSINTTLDFDRVAFSFNIDPNLPTNTSVAKLVLKQFEETPWINFSCCPVGLHIERSFVISNCNTHAEELTFINKNPLEFGFSLDSQYHTIQLQPGQEFTVNVGWTPTSAGNVRETLHFKGKTGVYRVILFGTGVAKVRLLGVEGKGTLIDGYLISSSLLYLPALPPNPQNACQNQISPQQCLKHQ